MRRYPISTEGFLYVAAAVLAGVSLLGKSRLLKHFVHLPTPLLMAGLAIFLCLPFLWRQLLPYRRILGSACLLGLALMFLAVFPKVEGLHKEGRGSDQPDCVIVASHLMAHHQWPYVRAAMFSKNALSCGPGWVAMQSPAVELAGYKWNLLLCWLAAIAVMIAGAGFEVTAGVLTLVALSPGTWITAANGSDFLTFGIALVAFLLVMPGRDRQTVGIKLLIVIFLGLLIQFRIPTLLLPGFLTKQIGRGTAIAAWALGTVCQVGFLLWNPQAFVDDGPLHVAAKLMKTGVLSYRPGVAAGELALGSALGMAAVMWLGKRFRPEYAILTYLWLIFFLPAVQDFVLKYARVRSVSAALEIWEGSTWMAACVPLGAMLLVGHLQWAAEAADEPETAAYPEERKAA